eukprot:GEMP01042700.1.p1 GENE.GEMP01042700.1~~GEMP01042700.1.p1  ORF type:complete len:270 (+),score=53.90 GEMP01042700.1:73-882(+)
MATLGFDSLPEISESAQPTEGSAAWSKTDGTEFKVRSGPDYKKNKTKSNSEGTLYDCVGADLVTADSIISDIVDKVDFSRIPTVDAKDLPSLIIVNAQVPLAGVFTFGSKDAGVSQVSYFTIKPEVAALIGSPQEPKQFKLLRELLERNRSDASLAWKAMARVDDVILANLPQVISKFNGKPALITESASLRSGTLANGSRYLEVDFDVRKWSLVARTTVGQTKDFAKTVSMHVGFLVEGTDNGDLPEQIMCALVLHNMDPAQAKVIPL